MRSLVLLYRKWLGKDLPARDLVIQFTVPATVKKTKMPKLSALRPDPYMHEVVDTVLVLKAFQSNLRQLNKCQISIARRLAYTEKVAKRLMPIALPQIRSVAGEGRIPDPPERKESLDLIIDISRRLLESYRLVFKRWYGVSNARFAYIEKRFDLAGYRIIEISRFLQRVMGLRYQQLSEQAWLSVNIVFHVLHGQGKAEMQAHSFEDVYSETHSNRRLQDLYLMLQMNARLDTLRWPTEWQFSLDSYGRIVHALLKLEEDHGNILRADESIAYCYDDGPARSMRIPGQTTRGQGILINWKLLRAKLQRDYQRNLANQAQRSDQRAFSMLSYADGLALLSLQKNCWESVSPPLPDKSAKGQQCDLHIFIGFKGIYPFLFNLHYGTGPAEKLGARMVDLLAQRSALFAEDHRSTSDSLWMMLSHDEERIVLRTEETDYTTQMRIGVPIAYGFGEMGLRSSALGCISRIYRPNSEVVIVEVEKLGNSSEPVLLIPDLSNFAEFDQQHKEIFYGILALQGLQRQPDQADAAHLLLPAHCTFYQGHQLVMKRVGKRQIIELNEMLEASKTFRKYSYTVSQSCDA